MIFVTVGTHEQGMDRLLIELDRLIENNLINQEVIAQIGYSKYRPKNYQYSELISYEEMDELVEKADIVITHGGPGSIFHTIHYKKVPIVVPRNPIYNEHVDDHQILFANRLENEKKIISVYEISSLRDIINHYSEFEKKCVYDFTQKKEFIKKFDELINVKLRLV